MDYHIPSVNYEKACKDLKRLVFYEVPGGGGLPGDFWFDSEESLFSFLSCLTERWEIPEGIIVPGFTHETVYEDSDNPGSNRISFRSGGSGAVRNYVITANSEDSFYRLDIGHYVSCYADTDSLVRIMDSENGSEI